MPPDATDTSPAGTAHPKMEISGLLFECPIKYTEGHTLTEAEALALEQTRRENLRNNFAKTVKKAIDSSTGELSIEAINELTERFSDLAANYQFSRTTIKSALDPVEKKAHDIAGEMLTSALSAQNIKKSQLQEGVFDAKVLQILAAQPEIYKEAKARIERAQAFAADIVLSL